MSTTTKKAYVYKMNLVPANVLGIVIFIVLLVFSYLIKADMLIDMNLGVLFLIMLLDLAFHELLQGVG